MSIYSTLFSCDCNEDDLPAPIIYHHSGHYPKPDERHGYFEMSAIPGHINDKDEDEYCPYLRFSIAEASDGEGMQTVVLDREQAQELLETLKAWAQRVSYD